MGGSIWNSRRWGHVLPALAALLAAALLLAACGAGGGTGSGTPSGSPAGGAAGGSGGGDGGGGAAAGDCSQRPGLAGVPPLPQEVTVKIAEDGAPSGAGFYIATEKGYFRDLCIKPEFVTFESSAYMLPALAADQVQVAGGVLSVGLWNAIQSGLDLRLIATKGENVPGRSYFNLTVAAGKAAEIKDYADLKGKRIAITAEASLDEQFVDLALRHAGLTRDDVEYVIIKSFGDMNAALANGAVDVAMHIEPLITQAEEQGILKRFGDAARDYAPGFQIAEVLASPKFVADKELSQRFMLAYVKALRDYNDAFVKRDEAKMAEIIPIMTKYTALKDPELWKKVYVPGLNPDGRLNVESLQAQLDWYRERGYFTGQIDLNKVVDQSLVEYAVQVLGPYDGGQ
ncbi:ABC transporter substrate-binding protein [Thermaerobacter subterraneus]|uniref:ABC-type nitrate/sulfonate/bicarbonate transport system, periplasmic component n=1 Tax=Thermaerobacter subterraneus DSM 13965 TaxID=867903 RepID=K6NZP3_9FIRM|nr:ABC transporter substrate-binding protein [Thermaerobacter subterraneus]EKP94345.1 ABC-type nitrate/sulfonate/bicarbonate transport system, periplasmic component [Thermaerobacter subterraneus DSM 13965]